jgi:hypothetical protein
MAARSLAALMALAGWLWAGSVAAAETLEVWPAGAAQPEVLAVQPLSGAVTPVFRTVPRFNLHISLSGSGEPYVATGLGNLQATGGGVSLMWQINQLSLGGRKVQGKGKPLMLSVTRMDARGAPLQAVTTFPAYFEAGGANLATSGADYMLVRALGDAMAAGWGIGAGKPIASGQQVFDANRLVTGFLARLVPGTTITKPLARGTAVGLVDYQGKQAIVARIKGQAGLRNADVGGNLTLVVDGFALLDVATGLPVYTDAALTLGGKGGSPGAAILQTHIEY